MPVIYINRKEEQAGVDSAATRMVNPTMFPSRLKDHKLQN